MEEWEAQNLIFIVVFAKSMCTTRQNIVVDATDAAMDSITIVIGLIIV